MIAVVDRKVSDILPLHTSTEIEALREDLKANGLKVTVVIDENGGVIDGRLRAKLCDELKIDWRQTAKVEAGLTRRPKGRPPHPAEPPPTQHAADRQPAAGVRADAAQGRRQTLQRHRRQVVWDGPQQRLPDSLGDGDERGGQGCRGDDRPGWACSPKAGTQRASEAPLPRQLRSTPPMEIRRKFSELPQAPVCDQADVAASTQRHESLPLPSAAVQPRGRWNQRFRSTCGGRGPPAENEEGSLDCSSFKLTLVRAVSARNGCWEWMAKDEQGNCYHVSCRRVETEARKVG